MQFKNKHPHYLLLCVALIIAALAATPVLAQDNGVRQDGNGKYANLTAQWWQWGFAQPAIDKNGTNTNPLVDSTGAYATAGQANGIGPANKYFFLAGYFGSGALTRYVTVPAGKTLFFPAINFDADNATDPPTSNNVPQLRAVAKAAIDPITDAFATLDGQKLELMRVKSPTFSYTLPSPREINIYCYFILKAPGSTCGDQFAGTVSPAVSDGLWAVVPPLPAGIHTIHFGSPTYGQDITYILTVP